MSRIQIIFFGLGMTIFISFLAITSLVVSEKITLPFFQAFSLKEQAVLYPAIAFGGLFLAIATKRLGRRFFRTQTLSFVLLGTGMGILYFSLIQKIFTDHEGMFTYRGYVIAFLLVVGFLTYFIRRPKPIEGVTIR